VNESAFALDKMVTLPGALSMIIHETGIGSPVMSRYATSRRNAVRVPPLEKMWKKTGRSGSAEARIASTAGVR